MIAEIKIIIKFPELKGTLVDRTLQFKNVTLTIFYLKLI